MRTIEEISAEITALKALRPIGTQSYTTARKILACIRELEPTQGDLFDGLSSSTGETDEEIKSILMDVRNWKNGSTNYKPSEGWGKLVQ